jgi:hypothetical protein
MKDELFFGKNVVWIKRTASFLFPWLLAKHQIFIKRNYFAVILPSYIKLKQTVI